MPRSFTDSEKSYIREKLIEAAKSCLAQYGVRKTTIDELVNRAKISKGTFYLFYRTKELLFFDVFCMFHDEIHADLIARTKMMNQSVDVQSLTELIFSLYKKIDNSFVMNLISNDEIEMVMHNLPEDSIKANTKKDDFSTEQLLGFLPNIPQENIKTFSAALRGIFLTMLHRHDIGDNIFDEALKLMIRGVVLQIFEK